MSQPEYDRVFSRLKYNRQDMIDLLGKFFGFEGPDGTYFYCLMRVKEAFSYGTVTLDDFEEMPESMLEELADQILAMLTSPPPKETNEENLPHA